MHDFTQEYVSAFDYQMSGLMVRFRKLRIVVAVYIMNNTMSWYTATFY